jgi:hypothetical protein
MTVWAIRQSYRFEAVPIISESEKMVLVGEGKGRRVQKVSAVAIGHFASQGILPWRGSEFEARKLACQLTSVFDEGRRRKAAAGDYMRRESERLLGLDAVEAVK